MPRYKLKHEITAMHMTYSTLISFDRGIPYPTIEPVTISSSLLGRTTLNTNSHTQLLSKQTDQTRAVPQVDPVTDGTALLGIHACVLDDPVKSFWAGYWGAQPNLLVWRLLVEDVDSVGREGDV